MDSNKNCGKCLFWQELPHNLYQQDIAYIEGECHRMPPETDSHLSYFPKTKGAQWCGEFKPSNIKKKSKEDKNSDN